MMNYENQDISDEQIAAFRKVLQGCWEESLGIVDGKSPAQPLIVQWNEALLKMTEGRKTIRDPQTGELKVFYSWCGDWVAYHLEQAGCLHGLALNRQSINGKWEAGFNLAFLQAWAGDPSATSNSRLRDRFKSDPTAGSNWHPWNNAKDVCVDDYLPQSGDLIICPRKGGNHIEFWVSRDVGERANMVTVSAGAQAGGTACVHGHDMDVTEFAGIIDVSKLSPSSPY